MADIKKDDNTKETTNFRNQLNFLYGIIDVARLVYDRKVSGEHSYVLPLTFETAWLIADITRNEGY